MARLEGKVLFVDGALPGEHVRVRITGSRKSYSHGQLLDILSASPHRVDPPCEYFGTCGGCVLQHLAHEQQLEAKHKQLVDNLQHIAKVSAGTWLPPLSGPQWGYRRKARLSVRYVEKKGGVLVGFRERHKSFVTPLAHCKALAPQVSRLLPTLPELVAGLSCYTRIPQIEIAVAENATALVVRHLEPLTDADRAALREYAKQNAIEVLLQSKGPESIRPCYPDVSSELVYTLPNHGIEIQFGPADFIQVNGELNRRLVDLAIELLEPAPTDVVMDLFCGLGNFTLPIARKCARVYGFEGDAQLLRRVDNNVRRNDLHNVEFRMVDLYGDAESLQGSLCSGPWSATGVDKMVLDPPRSGAIDVVKLVPRIGPKKILYISCNPASLARDSELLVHKHGFQLRKAGIVDMFPHTAHVESVALFERD